MRHPVSRGPIRLLTAVLLATVAVLLNGAAPALAAPVFVTVGQVAPTFDALMEGGCTTCNAIPYASVTSPLYAFGFDGVLTRWSVQAKTIANPVETVRPRTWRRTGATTSTLVAQGATRTLTTPSTIHTFWDRIPATAGDLLGARFDTGAGINETPPTFTNGSATGDVAVRKLDSPAVPVGGTVTEPGVANRRVNISARLEHDEDRDGYGDGSQDLCPADATRATGACSGTLFGSDLQGYYVRSGFSCTYACARVQRTTAGGTPTATTADGVVVRWRLQAPPAGSYRVRVIAPTAGGGFVFAGSSVPVMIDTDEALRTFPTRLQIPAGGFVALVPPTFTNQIAPAQTPPTGATFDQINDGAAGATASLGPPADATAGVVWYDADIEADADRDGYGDETQDACPTDATTQGTCPVVPPPGPGTSTPTTPFVPGFPAPVIGPALPAVLPTITALRLNRKRFRVNRRGAVLATTAPAGATILTTLSARSRVRFTVRRLGARRTSTVHAFTRMLAQGRTTTRYSARYRRAGRVRTLSPGRYRLDAQVLSASGRAGPVTSRRFTVVR